MLEHGGRLQRAAAHYGIPLARWVDLSTGINPRGWPLPPIPREVWTRLPEDEDGLEAAARDYYGCRALLPTAGTQAAIQALPGLRGPSRVAVLAPAYAEHAQAWRRAGHDVVATDAAALLSGDADADVVVVVNPNNPTGARFDRDTLLALHARLAARGGWLVVDEAFIDMTQGCSLAAHTDREGLVVLRSPGKFFGLAGARAGFVLAETSLLARLRERLGPWTVAAPTRWLLQRAFADRDWQIAARASLAADAVRLRHVLERHGLAGSSGTDLFQWIPLPDAARRHDALAREAVLTRRFDAPASLRFGLPGDEAAWERLDAALARVAAAETHPLPCPPLEGEGLVGLPLESEGFVGPPLESKGLVGPPLEREGLVGLPLESEGSESLPLQGEVFWKPSPSRGGLGGDGVPPAPPTATPTATPAQRRAGVLMIQGTTSDAGKSTLVAGLCRWLHRRGVAVAPFKPQNMALNSAVTVDGGEIGRAQALQAQAAGLPPHTDFNPILLKPDSDLGAQVIVHGRAIGKLQAAQYHDYKRVALQAVLASHARLVERHAAVVVEGAGSPAEINLRANDIANMGYAEAVDCPVILIADIDRGGVFAHLVGTLALLSTSEQARVRGFVINRFRGDLALLQPGLDWLERETGKPVLGVLPYLHGLDLDAEDALPRETGRDAALRVVVPALPRISNHTDFDALRLHPAVDFRYVGPGQTPPAADLIVLPGSKSVRADLAWLRDNGWEPALQTHLRYGGKLLGICGGLQMLGQAVHDPHGIEGAAGSNAGLGLLDLQTTLEPDKQLRRVHGELHLAGIAAAVDGYEIHCGVSSGAALARPLLQLADGRADGALSADGRIAATYVHGLFDTAAACAALLRWAGLADAQAVDRAVLRERALERLADAVEQHLDLAALRRLLGLEPGDATCAP